MPTTSDPAISSSSKFSCDFDEESGVLPDGTPYLIWMPKTWTGVLIRDLDFASGARNPERIDRFRHMVARGHAVAGTARHRLRQWQYDPVREIGNLERVLDLFETRRGKPEIVLQYGCSGGGHVALAVSEEFHDRVDGAVALAAHTPVWLMNSFLDGWFALKVLLEDYYVDAGYGPASDLSVTELPNDGSANPSGHGLQGKLPEAWRKAFAAAQETPEGRARIALAFTLGQWGAWLADDTPQPALDDPDALQGAMYASLLRLSHSPGGEARILFENAAQGQQLSWNDDVDYAAFFESGNSALKKATEHLYRSSGADLGSDIARINSAPRIEASSHALDFWGKPGRTMVGNPKIPVIRFHMVGDYQIPYTLLQGYEDLIEANERGGLVRTSLVCSTGHCNFTPAESSTGIEVMLQRVRTGEWPDATPDGLNAVAATLKTETPARFMERAGYEVRKYNRGWVAPYA
jgi:hypothetical protein